MNKTLHIFNPSSINFNGKKYTIARGEDYKNSPPPRGFFNGQSTYWLKEGSSEYVKLKFNTKGEKFDSYIKKDVNPDYKFPEDIRFIHGTATIENGDIIALATCTILNEIYCDDKYKKVVLNYSAGYCSVNLSKLEITNIKKFDPINQINPNKNWMSFKHEDLFYVIYSMFPLIYTTAQKLENISFSNVNLNQNINLRNSCNPINVNSNKFKMLCHKRSGEHEYDFHEVDFEIRDKKIIIKEKKEINTPEDKSYLCSLEKEGMDIFALCGVHDRYCSRFKLNRDETKKDSIKERILVITPDFYFGNLGDAAIEHGCENVLKSNGKNFYTVKSRDEQIDFSNFSSLIVFGNDILAYYGGFGHRIKYMDAFLAQNKKVFVLNCSWGENAIFDKCFDPYKDNPDIHIYFRDKKSLEMINKKFNFRNPPKLCADLAHLCPRDNHINDKKITNWIESDQKKIIGINIHKDFKEYNGLVWQNYKKIINYYSKHFRFMMIPHDSRDHAKEKELLMKLSSECEPCDFIVTDYLHPSQEKIITKNLYFLITGRMHLSILTITQNIPCIVIEYNGVKSKGTLSHWGMERYVLKASNSYKLFELCEEVIKSNKDIRSSISSRHEDVKRLSLKPFNDIFCSEKQNRNFKIKQQEFIDLKKQWLSFFNNDRFGKHRKLFDWVKYTSSQIPATQEPEDRFNCFNPFKKIAIVSLYTKEISEFAIYSEKSIKDYCQKQGYSFYVYRESLDRNGSPNWSKSQALLNHIDNHDYIVWMDSDTLIFNPEKKLESIIEKAPKKFILATKDIGDHCMLNSGVLFFKSHQYTKNLITKWRDFNGDKSSLYASGGDQEILCEILRKSDGYGFNRKIFEMNEFNTDPRLVNEDTFILHFMAYPHELKKIFMSYWCS